MKKYQKAGTKSMLCNIGKHHNATGANSINWATKQDGT